MRTTFCITLLCIAETFIFTATGWSQGQPTFTEPTICRAAMGFIMAHDPKAEHIVKTEGGVTYLRYVRPSDKTIWTTRCRIADNRVYWASDPGRWRDDPRDEIVTYEVDNSGLKLIEHYTDGSPNEKTYRRSDL